jgi:ABC-2 type transport system ATP-binding protein
MEPALLLESVSKSFGDNRAVNGLDLRVEPGTICGLLGPNGSGKSTTMKMIIGLARPDSGAIRVCGINVLDDPMGVKGIVGYVPETPRLYEFLTGAEYLDFVGDAYGLESGAKGERVSQFLKAFDLEGREDEMISGYSHGMKQKVAIVGALLHEPRLLLLDEPLAGLDPKSARIMKDLLRSLAGRGVATILSTHVLDIADAVCDRVCVMYKGEKVGDGTPSELRRASRMTESSLEEVFLKLTGSVDLRDIVEALSD